MADIHLERKERSVWPWVLAILLLLALLIWWLFGRRGDLERTVLAPADSAVESVMSTGDTESDGTGAVDVFDRWNQDRQARSAMDLDHTYTATGIRNLAAALESLTPSDAKASIENDLTMVRANADTLWRNASSSEHANYVRSAFLRLANAMSTVDDRHTADLRDEIGNVRQSAEALRTDRPLLDQRNRVQAFFDNAAEVIRGLANEA
jgi:hypothetical protein